MENIKFIRQIMSYGNKEGKEIGNYMVYDLGNGNRAKVCVNGGNIWGQSHGIEVTILHKLNGKIDFCYFPFSNYFQPVQCSPGAPKWYQHIENGRWYFSQMYSHVLPKSYDYENIASAVEEYMDLFA